MLRSADKKLFLNNTVSGEVFNREWPGDLRRGRERIIHMASPEFGIQNFVSASVGSGSVTWASANKPIAIPFAVFRGITVYQLGWKNGSGTMTDSVDIGIYDLSWNRLVSGGGTSRSGASALQFVDVTDTYLRPGRYYLAMSNNGTTANNALRVCQSLSAVMLSGLGVLDSATDAYPLPNPLTNMVAAATFTSIPLGCIAARVPF